MCEEDIYDELWETEWVKIPEVPYAAKFKFHEDRYIILISDLSEVYGEKLTETDIQERFCILNPYAEMKSRVILKHVKQSLEDSLFNSASKIKLQPTFQGITIRLQFEVIQVNFIFDVKPQLLPCTKLRTHLLAPTILTALSVHQENLLLKQKIKNMENDKSVLQIKKDEHSRTIGNSKIHKKSKISQSDILDSFLNLQQTIQRCISESKVINADPTTHIHETSSSMLPSPKNNSPEKIPVKEELSVAENLKYEDMKDTEISTMQKSFTTNLVDQCEIPTLPVKREIEDSSKSESGLVPSQIHTKLKKKKGFKF